MSKEKSKEYIVLQSIIGSKSVSFHPDFARALGSVSAGLFLSQGFFWQFNAQHIDRIEIEGKQYFSRTISEWEKETALSEEQQKGARLLLSKAGVLTEKKAGLPARLYYNFDFDALVAVIYGYKETGQQVAVDNRSKKRYLPRTSSGKIRQQEAVKHGGNYKEREFKESLRENEREAQAPAPAQLSGNSEQLSINPLHLEGEKEKNPSPFPAPPSLNISDRPNAKTPSELVAAMRKFYTEYQHEWHDGVIELSKGKKYSEERQIEIVLRWAGHMITQNSGNDTYQMLNASLQKWFLRQVDFDRQYPSKAQQSQTFTPPVRGEQLPAYVD